MRNRFGSFVPCARPGVPRCGDAPKTQKRRAVAPFLRRLTVGWALLPNCGLGEPSSSLANQMDQAGFLLPFSGVSVPIVGTDPRLVRYAQLFFASRFLQSV